MEISNTLEAYVQLWRKLEETRLLLLGQCRRFCVRNILRSWFPAGNRPREDMRWDDFVWEVCYRSELLGLDELPQPSLQPRPSRELLRALAQVSLHVGSHQVNVHALDEAYSLAFPDSTPLNVSKKRKT